MIIEDNLKVAKLLDVYGAMLTEKQYQIMSSYYFDNLTISEIGDNLDISRQAVNDCLSQSTKILENFESKLCFVKKYDTLKLRLKQMLNNSTNDNLTNRLQEIMEMLEE